MLVIGWVPNLIGEEEGGTVSRYAPVVVDWTGRQTGARILTGDFVVNNML